MCDYSLYAQENRLAVEGEELVLHRFATGSLGFASKGDLAELTCRQQRGGYWAAIKSWLALGSDFGCPAVCIPPGAQLLLTEVPAAAQTRFGLRDSEAVTFTELSERSFAYRDALILRDGSRVLLQDLPEGIHASVLDLSPSDTELPNIETDAETVETLESEYI
jgi:hypothetical protein